MKNKKILDLKNRKAEVFGMSFSMIFAIIMIVFFIVVAFIGIRFFLGWQKNAQIISFVQNLEAKINEVWNPGIEVSTSYSGVLPSGIEWVCFVNWNLNITSNANDLEKGVISEIKSKGINFRDNFYLYAPSTNLDFKSKELKHLDLSNHNPVCIKVVNQKVKIGLAIKQGKNLVEVSE